MILPQLRELGEKVPYGFGLSDLIATWIHLLRSILKAKKFVLEDETGETDRNSFNSLSCGTFVMAAERHTEKCVLITGAGGGIGRAAALRLAKEGAYVVANDLSEDNLATLKSEISEIGGQCEILTGSVAELEPIDLAFDIAMERFGRLDGLVNNAGIGGPMKRFDKVERAEFENIIDINLRPVWYAMKRAFGAMKKNGGAIVNVASMAGIRPNRHQSPYGMTKAAVISLTHHAAMDFAPANIRVNALCPGPVETPMFDQMRNFLDDEGYQRARKLVQSRTVMDRYGTPEEQAAAISFLLSDDASFVTGVAMPVDGGWSVSDGRKM